MRALATMRTLEMLTQKTLATSPIELVDGRIKTATLVTEKELPKVAAQNLKKRKLQVIEEESSDEETGESICCGIRFVCWILKLIGDEQATCLAPENAILRLIAH